MCRPSLLVLPLLMLVGCAPTTAFQGPSGAARTKIQAPAVGHDGARPRRFFADTSFWNQRLTSDEPLDARSAEDGARLARQARYTTKSQPVRGYWEPGYGAIIASGSYSVPIYTVPDDQPRVPVRVVESDDRTPASWAAELQALWQDVPIPLGIDKLEAEGTDGHLAIYQPSTDTMWEFWVFRTRVEGGTTRYSARYGARIDGVSRSSGVLPRQMGARATSLALVGGVITHEDIIAGSIHHALAISVPVVDARAVAPATRTDGPSAWTPTGDTRDAISEGMRFRLPADYDCTSAAGGVRQRLQNMLCTAARDYGLVVVDRSRGVSFYAEDRKTLGTPYQAVSGDPWEQLTPFFHGKDNIVDDLPWEALLRLNQVRPLRGAP